jgi:hypothetical protein
VMAVADEVLLQYVKEAIHQQRLGLLTWYLLLLHDNARARAAYTCGAGNVFHTHYKPWCGSLGRSRLWKTEEKTI